MFCNNCGKKNPENSKFCRHCGKEIKGINSSSDIVENNVSIPYSQPDKSKDLDYPYVISSEKFTLLSILTCGLFEVYWFYRHFRSFKKETDWRITPWARSLFCTLTAYTLFNKINELLLKTGESEKINVSLLAIVYFILNALWRLPDPYWLFSLFAFVPLLPVQKSINVYWTKKYGSSLIESKFRGTNWIWAIGGSIFLGLALLGTFGY